MNGRKSRALRRIKAGNSTSTDRKMIQGHLERIYVRSQPKLAEPRRRTPKAAPATPKDRTSEVRNCVHPVRQLKIMSRYPGTNIPDDSADTMTLGAAKSWRDAGNLPKYILNRLVLEALLT